MPPPTLTWCQRGRLGVTPDLCRSASLQEPCVQVRKPKARTGFPVNGQEIPFLLPRVTPPNTVRNTRHVWGLDHLDGGVHRPGRHDLLRDLCANAPAADPVHVPSLDPHTQGSYVSGKLRTHIPRTL